MTRRGRLMAFTAFALGAILIHGLYHIAEAGFVPRVFYDVLHPFFAPSLIGWYLHVFMELMGIAALCVAFMEYRDADIFEVPERWFETETEDTDADWDADVDIL